MRALALVLMLVAAGPAAALSCLRPDVARTYAEAAASEDAFVVVEGRLTFDEARLPQPPRKDPNATRPDTLIPARLVGHSLTAGGFTRAFDRAITLNAQCLGPWCAGAASGERYLAFLRRTGDAHTLDLTPCGGFGFAQPSREQLGMAAACMAGGPCTPAPGTR